MKPVEEMQTELCNESLLLRANLILLTNASLETCSRYSDWKWGAKKGAHYIFA